VALRPCPKRVQTGVESRGLLGHRSLRIRRCEEPPKAFLIQDRPAHVRPAQERDVPERLLLKEPRPDRVGQHPLQELDLAVEGRRSRCCTPRRVIS
jgi:hypothetical protein